jgi:tRNA(Ile)-lysidine synthase
MLPDLFLDFFNRHHLPTGRPVLVAVSGGVDSVVLAHLCHRAGIPFTIVHVNFGLRGAESRRDEDFVRNFAKQMNVTVLVKHFDTEEYAKEQKLSIQEAARNLRYGWFRTLLPYTGAVQILLAHHANDNIETLLMNFFRGTGLEGLTGIKELSADGSFARPLLHATRTAIENYARAEGLQWVEDSSNASSKYTRNFFRNELLPSISKAYPEVEENLLDNIERFKQINELYQSSIKRLRAELCEAKGEEVWMPVRKLQKLWQPALVYELIRPYGFNEKQVTGVQQLLSAGSGKFIANDKWQLIRHRNWLVLAPRTVAAETIVIDKENTTVKFRGGQLTWKMLEGTKLPPGTDPQKILLDAGELEFPLLLRPWKAGDYFYPLGMRKKKKLSRFFIDVKLSKHQKESVWVLESNRRILWVIGLRIDDRFRITENTRSAIEITWDNGNVGR